MSRRPHVWLAAALVAALGSLSIAVVASPAAVTVAHAFPRGSSVPVTMAPVGLSIEYPLMAQDLGTGPCPPPALTAELERLGSPPLSLAGDSQDLTAPAGALGASPASWESATLYPLPASFWSQLHCLLSATRDPLTAGVNLKTGALSWATQIAAGAAAAATNGLNFSVGNEPDLYALPDYSSLGTRVRTENLAAVNLYLQLVANLQQTIGQVPLVGPELANAAHWQRQLPRVIAQLHMQTVGVHMYPLSACETPRAVTVGGLLSAYAADEPSRLAWVVADARAAGVPAIISEANSASCGGAPGVSDSPAAAVWAVRFVLRALKSGFGEVRFHFSGGAYDPFVVRGEQVLAQPLEAALVALNAWLPVGSSLRTLGGVPGLLATSVTAPRGDPEVIFDNEHPRSETVVLQAPGPITLEQLSALRPRLLVHTLVPRRGRIKLTVAPSSLAAIASQR